MNYFSNWDRFYQLKPQGGQWGNHESPPDDHVVKFLNFVTTPNLTVLDSGCADGKNSVYLDSKGHTVYGIDISQTVIDRVSQNVQGHFSVQDCKKTNFNDCMFDAIVDAGCLHVNEPLYHRDILQEYYRILKPGGYLNIRFFNTNKSPTEPIFSVAGEELHMPVYGFTQPMISSLVSGKFEQKYYTFNPTYGATGLGCHNYILAKID